MVPTADPRAGGFDLDRVRPPEPAGRMPDAAAVASVPARHDPDPPARPAVKSDGVPADARKALVAAMKAGYPKALADAAAEVRRAKAGTVTGSVKKTFVPPAKSVPIQCPSKDAKEEFVRQAEDKLREFPAAPDAAAPRIAGPVGAGTVGRVGRAYVARVVDADTAEVYLLDVTGQPDRSKRAVVDGTRTADLTSGQMGLVPVVFCAVGSADQGAGRQYTLRAVTLTPDELREVTGARD